MPINKFEEHTVKEHGQSLGHYLPNGNFWAAKFKEGTNLKNLLLGLAAELLRKEQIQNRFVDQYIDIANTTDFIEEWEKQLGIPDECIEIADILEERRTNILLKIAAIGLKTRDDYIALAALLGFEIEIENLTEKSTFPLVLPFTLGSLKSLKFSMKITFLNYIAGGSVFPLLLPFTLGRDETAALRCLFLKLKPAYVNIVFEIPAPPVAIFSFIFQDGNNFIFQDGDNYILNL